MNKELVCTNCGCNRFVKQYHLVPAEDQTYPGADAVKAKVETAGISSLDPEDIWIVHTAPFMLCAKCQRETTTLKFQE